MRQMIGLAAALSAALSFGTALAQGCTQESLDKGERIFMRCKACHSIEQGRNRIGPSLFGVVGRPVASEPGYNYSDAMKAYAEGGAKWTADRLSTFLENPRKVVPGTRMAFAGLPAEEDRANLICYLDQFH